MINWENTKFDIGIAKKSFDKLEVKSDGVVPINPPEQFQELRSKLIEARDTIFDKYDYDRANKLDYQFDLLFGLKLYEILDSNMNFKTRDAMNDEVWRYLSIKIIPDIVHSRWEMNEDHFYKTPRRIWLKTLWWYIHLSWNENLDSTYEILKDNTTDTIMNLVERPGIGYNINLYRELMKQYYNYEDSSRNLFRRVLKINTAKLLTTSPELVDGGLESYVKDLFIAAE